jgi:hypothetical protein
MSIEIILIPLAIKAGAFILGASIVAARKSAAEDPDPENVICFETQFKDLTLLQRALQDFNYPCIVEGGQLETSYTHARLIFAPDEMGVFNAYLVGEGSINEVQVILADLHAQYKRLVQQQTYETLLSRAKEKNMLLEREEILEDNSVVLTFTIS